MPQLFVIHSRSVRRFPQPPQPFAMTNRPELAQAIVDTYVALLVAFGVDAQYDVFVKLRQY